MVVDMFFNKTFSFVHFLIVFIIIDSLWVVQIFEFNLPSFLIIIIGYYCDDVRFFWHVSLDCLLSVKGNYKQKISALFLFIEIWDFLDTFPFKF